MAPSSATRNGSLPSFEFQAFNPFRPAFMESGLALKESSISVKEVPYVGVEARIFLCRGTVDGRQRQFALKYLIRAHCWCLMDRVY